MILYYLNENLTLTLMSLQLTLGDEFPNVPCNRPWGDECPNAPCNQPWGDECPNVPCNRPWG